MAVAPKLLGPPFANSGQSAALIKMILTTCPACAAPLPEVAAKQCSRCKTRYCGAACQKKHWEEGGHDKCCKKIRKGGGAEQYHADKKCKEAVAVAAEACVEDTKGQTCYICTEVVHRRTKEGLVRGCACRGTAGFAHVSCLAEQAKILVAEAVANNLDHKVQNARWDRWHACSLCEQQYHGVVFYALGWACWKTYYLGRDVGAWEWFIRRETPRGRVVRVRGRVVYVAAPWPFSGRLAHPAEQSCDHA